MLTEQELSAIARARLQDAEVLFSAGRYDGAEYLCGYTVEIALKARICRTLSWRAYPSTNREFRDLQSFKTHNLDVLLRLSGVEAQIKGNYLADWSAVVAWDPAARYNPIGSATSQDVGLMIESAKNLLEVL